MLAVCALTAYFDIVFLLGITGMAGQPPWTGRWGMIALETRPFVLTVRSVHANGAAARAGVNVGDTLDSRENGIHPRAAYGLGPLVGRPLSVLFGTPNGTTVRRTIVPTARGASWDVWVLFWQGLWSLIFAVAIAWKMAENLQARLLSIALSVTALSGVIGPYNLVTPWLWANIILAAASFVVGAVSIAIVAALASTFALPVSRARRLLQSICYALTASAVAISLMGLLGIMWKRIDSGALLTSRSVTLFGYLALATAIWCAVLALRKSTQSERARTGWLLMPLCVLVSTLKFSSAGESIFQFGYNGTALWLAVANGISIVCPVGLTYAVLARRMLDFGFVMNRAVVYAGVSVVLIAAFVLVEWGLGGWLSHETHVTDLTVSLCIALILGLSLRLIHRYVDHFVDRVFFRKRHEDEKALREYAHEAYISDRWILLQRTVREVLTHTDATSVGVFTNDGAGHFVNGSGAALTGQAISENDAAVLALRARHKPVDLEKYETALRGVVAFPMVSRGDVNGLLVCGEKRGGEAYAPDETDALETLAHGVGSALSALADDVNSKAATRAILREMFTELREELVSEIRRQASDSSSPR